MNFEITYEKRFQFFPEIIDISDGKEITETSGFYSANLSDIWNSAEDKTLNNSEQYFVWAFYSVIHKYSKEFFKNGIGKIKLSEIEKTEIKKKYFEVIEEAEKTNRKTFCCEMMSSNINNKCKTHDSIYDCPDAILDTNKNGKKFRILIHDGGTSGIEIKYCPWCAQKLK